MILANGAHYESSVVTTGVWRSLLMICRRQRFRGVSVVCRYEAVKPAVQQVSAGQLPEVEWELGAWCGPDEVDSSVLHSVSAGRCTARLLAGQVRHACRRCRLAKNTRWRRHSAVPVDRYTIHSVLSLWTMHT